MALLQPDKAIYHHPLNTATETIKSLPWTNFTANFSAGKVSNAVFGSAFGTEAEFSDTTTTEIFVLLLSPTSFVVVYRPQPSPFHGNAKVGTISGSEITFGAATEFSAVAANQIGAALLSPTTFVVVYQEGAVPGHGIAKIGTVSGTSITFGADAAFLSVDFSDASNFVMKLSGTSFVVAYLEIEEANRGTAKVGMVSGTDITFGAGAEIVLDAGFSGEFPLAALSGTSFVVAYRDVSNQGSARVGTVSGTDIAFGTETDFSTVASTAGRTIATAVLSATSFVVVYRDSTDSNHGTTKVGTVTGTDITFGVEAEFLSANGATDISAATLSATSFVVAYRDGSDSGHGTVKIGTVSGTTITFGAEAEFAIAAGGASLTFIAKLSTTSFIVAYRDNSDSLHGTAKIGSLPVGASLTGPGASYDSVIGATKLAYTGWLKEPSV